MNPEESTAPPTLRDIFQGTSKQFLNEKQCVRLLSQLTRYLASLWTGHNTLQHTDLSPQNVIVRQDTPETYSVEV